MRIATSTIYQLATQALLNQQAALAKTQNQIATGKRVQTPADDPVAAVQLHELARAQAQYQQYDKNSTAVTGRLQIEEQALADAGTVLQRARELVVQANTATLNDSDRKSIATELRSRLDELLSIGNRKDANGEYLFAGYSTASQPFARGASGSVQYAGDSGARRVEVEPTLQVQDSDPGSQLFMNIPAGNGLFVTGASSGNTGSGVIDAGSISQPGGLGARQLHGQLHHAHDLAGERQWWRRGRQRQLHQRWRHRVQRRAGRHQRCAGGRAISSR